jgi:hypothetical protein
MLGVFPGQWVTGAARHVYLFAVAAIHLQWEELNERAFETLATTKPIHLTWRRVS